MSFCTPTLQLLMKALQKLENWHMFGVILGVPYSQLRKIELNNPKDPDRCKAEMLQYWLNSTLVPKWNEVILALEVIDQLALASRIKHDYLLSAAVSEEEESSATSSATPPSSAFATTDEIKADVAVVSDLKELEASFGQMLVQVKRRLVLSKCDLSDALLFLDSTVGSEDFIGCDNFDKLMRQLQQDHVDVFNIYILQQLLACFDFHEQTEIIEAYNEKKESFLKHTTVLEFQHAVVSRVEPILASGKAVVTITISKEMASHRTLNDIEKLAMEGFEECHKKFVCLHAEPGSIIISWVFPKGLSGRLKQLANDNAAVFKDSGVVEVTVGGRRVFPYTHQEDMASSQGVSEKEEEESKLKTLYIEFYQQLVEAVSDPDTCHSLITQLHSTSLLSEEKKAVLSSSLASGRSFLKVLGVEEEPHLVTVLMEKMSAVKQLQTLSKDMSSWLSGSKQGAADTQFTGKQAYYEIIERQQLVADIEGLSSDKADLLIRLQCCEEVLKTANELLGMREKAISGMMAAVHRRDTDVEEREERISHLKKELDELRRERVERESLLTREIEDLKSKQLMQTDELNETIKSNSELSSQLVSAKQELEELRREKVERESLLTREIEDLKSKLMTKTDELNGAIKSNSELSSQLVCAKQELDELRRVGIENGEREGMLTREMEDLKSKLMKIDDEFNEAIKCLSSFVTRELEQLKKESCEDLESKFMAKINAISEDFKHQLKTRHKNPESSQTELAVETETPLFKLTLEFKKKHLPLPPPIEKSEREAVIEFTTKVKLVIQTCNDSEYYAALEKLTSPRIGNHEFCKCVEYPHPELKIIVGTFADRDAAIVKTEQGSKCINELATVFSIFTSAKWLLGLGVCFAITENLNFADVLAVKKIIAVETPKFQSSTVLPRGTPNPTPKSLKKNFCGDSDMWPNFSVCHGRKAKAVEGIVVSASFVVDDPAIKQGLRVPGEIYQGGEMEGWAQIGYTPEHVKSIIIKGIADFGDGKKDKTWQFTAAKAAVDYAHYKLNPKTAGHIDEL